MVRGRIVAVWGPLDGPASGPYKNSQPDPAMTLIELLFFAFFAFFAFIGALVAIWGHARYGWLGGAGGAQREFT